MLRRIGSHLYIVHLFIPAGKIEHILLVRTIGVELAALAEQPDELFGAGGDNPAAVRQCISYLPILHLAICLVRILYHSFSLSSRNGNLSRAVVGKIPV